MTRRFAGWVASFLALFVLAVVRPVWAHAAPHSILLLDLHASEVSAELRLPVAELEAALDRPLALEGQGRVVRERDTLSALVSRDLQLFSSDGAAWTIGVLGITRALDDQGEEVVAQLRLTPAPNHSVRTFRIVNDVIGRQIANHSTWIGLRRDFAQGFVTGPPTLLGITHYLHHTLLVERGAGGVLPGFRALFQLGMQHIAQGTDHLLFLFALLLPAPLLLVRTAPGGARWGHAAGVRSAVVNVLRVVTAFTLGHSLTLLLGSAGWLRLPSAPVETLIAVSILCSAAHAFRPLFPGREAWVAAGFGLVHGLAFAGALSELELEPGRFALALLGFNLGIEAMQLSVLALTFPWLLLLAATRAYAPFRVAGAVVAGGAAIAWIAERAFHLPTPVDLVANALTVHPLVALSGLAVTALVAQAFDRLKSDPLARRVAVSSNGGLHPPGA